MLGNGKVDCLGNGVGLGWWSSPRCGGMGKASGHEGRSMEILGVNWVREFFEERGSFSRPAQMLVS